MRKQTIKPGVRFRLDYKDGLPPLDGCVLKKEQRRLGDGWWSVKMDYKDNLSALHERILLAARWLPPKTERKKR